MGGALWLGEPWEVRFFEKSLVKSCDEGSEKVRKKREMDVSRGVGHLLVQNLSQEVQEHFGSRGKAKSLRKKLKIKDFGV